MDLLVDKKIIKPDSIPTPGDLDHFLNRMRKPSLDILWIDTKNTKPRKGRYKLKKTSDAFLEEITGETIKQANKNAFDLFSKEEILDLDELPGFPSSFQRSDVSFDGEDPLTFRKINHILYGIARKDLDANDKEMLKNVLSL